jgi:hypothetical protein
MYNLEITGERGITYRDYPQMFRVGELLSRKQVAERVGRSYGTALYHLERAVSAGLLLKIYSYIGNQPGWGYCLPETQLGIPGLEVAAENE